MRKLTISIRLMLLGIAVIALLFAFAGRQHFIGSRLRGLDAVITYRYQYDDWEDTSHYSLNNEAEQSPIRQYLGADFTSTIVTVGSSRSSDPAAVANLASQLPHLRSLSIQDAPLTDRDLIPIASLSELRGLYLCGTQITDGSVDTLARMSQLIVLNLRDTNLSESAIDRLKSRLPNTRIHVGIRQGGHM